MRFNYYADTLNRSHSTNQRICVFKFTDIKIGKYSQAISDCDECLSIEPNNVKAMLRRAEALNVSGRGNDAYRQYARVLELEPENPIAQKSMKTIPIR